MNTFYSTSFAQMFGNTLFDDSVNTSADIGQPVDTHFGESWPMGTEKPTRAVWHGVSWRLIPYFNCVEKTQLNIRVFFKWCQERVRCWVNRREGLTSSAGWSVVKSFRHHLVRYRCKEQSTDFAEQGTGFSTIIKASSNWSLNRSKYSGLRLTYYAVWRIKHGCRFSGRRRVEKKFTFFFCFP